MLWHKENEDISTAEYAGWKVTRIREFSDRYGRMRFTFICVKGDIKYTGSSWEYIRKKILKSEQLTIKF